VGNIRLVARHTKRVPFGTHVKLQHHGRLGPEAITVLAGTITLTPGTVSADLSDEGHSLLVHVLHTDDPDAVRDDIITRYQDRLKEIFR